MRKHLTLILALGLAACRSKQPDEDADGFDVLTDCDDADASVNPDAAEVCNGVDDNCNGPVDDAATDASSFYVDADADTVGNSGVSVTACAAPAGYVADDGDCDDANADIHPGATEDDCSDPIDYNCDGSSGFADADEDGWPACNDCDDKAAEISPAGVESCDGIDNNCDGSKDEAGALGERTFYTDADNDGFGDSGASVTACELPAGAVANADDCDDTKGTINPDASEICDTLDQNCNAVIDEDPTDAKTYYLDADQDGAGGKATTEGCAAPTGYVATSTDCDDLDAASKPGAAEICDAKDNNCDGAVPANETTLVYADADGDGHGNASVASAPCTAPTGYVASQDDCNDVSAVTYPGAAEICDAKDNNCDGAVPASETTPLYLDADGDGFGDPSVTGSACTAPSNFVKDATDCDDTRSAVNPDTFDRPGNGLDDDCAGDGDWHPVMYAVDRYSGDLWAVDRITKQLLWTADLNQESIDVTVGPDGMIYASNYNGGGILKVDPATHAVTSLVTDPTLMNLHGLNYDVSADRILATVGTGTIVAVDPSSGVLSTIVAAVPGGVIDAFHMEGDERIFITTRATPALVAYTPSSNSLATIVTLPLGPNLITGSLDRGKLFVAGNGAFYEIDVRHKSYRSVGTTTKTMSGSCGDPMGTNDLFFGDHVASLWGFDTGTRAITAFKGALGQTWGCASDAPPDADNDGFDNRLLGGTDCNDLDDTINPGVSTDVTDGVDRNCDGADGLDADGDGSDSVATGGTDCDDTSASVFLGTTSCLGAVSCLDILTEASQAPDGVYQINPLGTGNVPAYCDMTADGGGWTRVVNVRGNSIFHADQAAAVSDVSIATNAAKLSDAAINAITTGPWRWDCGTSKNAFVTNTVMTWTSAKVNTLAWSMDSDRNGTFECTANRSGYVFSDAISCSAGHTNYAAQAGASEGNGCYTTVNGWNQNGRLWAR